MDRYEWQWNLLWSLTSSFLLSLLLSRREIISTLFNCCCCCCCLECGNSSHLSLPLALYQDREEPSGRLGRRWWIDHDFEEKIHFLFSPWTNWKMPLVKADGPGSQMNTENNQKIPLFSLSRRDMEQGRGCRRLNKRGRSLMPSSLLAAICSVIGSVEGPAVCARRASRRPPLLFFFCKRRNNNSRRRGLSFFVFSPPAVAPARRHQYSHFFIYLI